MTDKRITGLTEVSSPAADDYVVMDGATTRKILVSNLIGGGTAGAATLRGNAAATSGPVSDFTIQGLTARGAPDAANDKMLLFDNSSGTLKYVTPGQVASALVAGVSSINTKTGALTLSITRQVFTASGTYTPTPGTVYVVVEAIGGGGGGGAVSGSASQIHTGGGGGSGGYSRSYLTAAAASGQTVTIGAAGGGGAAGSNNGTAGGNTSLGSLVVANGGQGGMYASTSQVGIGAAGGAAGTGHVSAAGAPGGNGFYNSGGTSQTSGSGFGGSSVFGGGGTPVNTSNGNAGRNYGAGGSGAAAISAVTQAGGNGSAGVLVITEYVIA